MSAQPDPVLQAIVAVSILLLGAKLLAELFERLHLPVVLGELGAGILLGPFYFGGLVNIPSSLIQVNDVVLAFGEIGAIVILFIAGLEMPFREFAHGGVASFTTGSVGVVLPFFGGLLLFTLLGFDAPSSLMIGAALTATSIAISLETLREMGHLGSPEGRLIIGAAVVDDVLAIAVLSVVLSVIANGQVRVSFLSVVTVIVSVLLLFGLVVAISLFISPRLANAKIWRTSGSIEAVVTSLFFGMAAVAGAVGLSPIVGSFAVGMALAGAQVAQRMRDYVEKLQFIFRPMFFAVIGAQVNLAGISLQLVLIGVVLIVIAVVTKLIGCGLPASFFLKSRPAGWRVGIGMISRGEVGLIVAGLAVAGGTISTGVYSLIVLMVIATTIIASVWLKRAAATPFAH